MLDLAIVGGGPGGLMSAWYLKKKLGDLCRLTIYEASDRVGGNWAYGNVNGMSSAYRSLHINTSRDRMEYSDFPMPKSYPDFPRHDHIARYFDDYVDHFGVRDRIRFETGRRTIASDAMPSPIATIRNASSPDEPEPPNPLPVFGSCTGGVVVAAGVVAGVGVRPMTFSFQWSPQSPLPTLQVIV